MLDPYHSTCFVEIGKRLLSHHFLRGCRSGIMERNWNYPLAALGDRVAEAMAEEGVSEEDVLKALDEEREEYSLLMRSIVS